MRPRCSCDRFVGSMPGRPDSMIRCGSAGRGFGPDWAQGSGSGVVDKLHRQVGYIGWCWSTAPEVAMTVAFAGMAGGWSCVILDKVPARSAGVDFLHLDSIRSPSQYWASLDCAAQPYCVVQAPHDRLGEVVAPWRPRSSSASERAPNFWPRVHRSAAPSIGHALEPFRDQIGQLSTQGSYRTGRCR